ncbi:transporter substrate-binding domain-containing protein [Shewanella olleyana]|uniref:transporter substrate-binding domain-containing protein n=1 Tax=Shewanella olleyana TaxID=135626 RepID=UPI00200DC28D|nr:transporter substrate-binding domain-containing protein [Shewanella olleyana]MCL1066595.1 transporter substrate-binding domain-containing protein [Shewanella olleyana]
MTRYNCFKASLIAFVCLFIADVSAKPTSTQVLRLYQTDFQFEYHIELLKIALDKTAADYPDTKLQFTEQVTPGRGLKMLEQGEVDIAFLASSKEREQNFIPIKIPLLKGLLGYRLLLIHQDNLEKFQQVTNTKDLGDSFVAGFGSHWADIEVLRHNNLPTQEVGTVTSLYRMLHAKRFDYFPRGVNEIWEEKQRLKGQLPDLMIEPNIALVYNLPVYVFVNKDLPELAARIEKGLNIATDDLSFQELFLKYYNDSILKARLSERNIIHLQNDDYPMTSTIDTSWWL